MERVLPNQIFELMGKSIEYVYSFAPMAEKTVFFVTPTVEKYVADLAEASGLEEDILTMTLGMFLCYPLGFIMSLLPYGKIKHLFSFLLGAFLLQVTLRKQWVHQMITSLVCYTIFLVFPAKLSKTIVPIFLMIYVSAGHLHRQYVNYLGWDMDFTSAQMVLTMKLYSLAYNLYDGHVLAKGIEDRAAKKCSHLAVPQLPGLIEYLGYTFCFSSVLAGPAYEYMPYASACDGSKMFDKSGKPLGKLPNRAWPTIQALVTSIFCLAVFLVYSVKLPLLDPANPQTNLPVLITTEFLAKPWIQRYMYTWASLFLIRQKYYFVWKNAEGSNNIWFAGFDGFDQSGKSLGWETSNNIDILSFELASNVKGATSAWNKKTANWLGRYVYMRTNGNLFATYAMSAFWHGFYPGYYLFFFSVPLLTFCERIGRKKISPHFVNTKLSGIYKIVCVLTTSFLIEYFIIAFQLLAWDWAFAGWKSHYFFGHLLCIGFYLLVSQLPTPKSKKL